MGRGDPDGGMRAAAVADLLVDRAKLAGTDEPCLDDLASLTVQHEQALAELGAPPIVDILDDSYRLENAAELEALMLRLWAHHVRDLCVRASEPVPPGAAAILGRDTPDRQVADIDAFREWCEANGLEFPVVDGWTGALHAIRPPDDGAATYRRQ